MTACRQAPREAVHNEAFNVGSTTENYRIRDVAEIVQSVVPESRVALSGKVGPDLRNYRVNCDKFAERVGFKTRWTVELGAREVFDMFERYGLTQSQLTGAAMQRLPRIKELLNDAKLGEDLRWLAVNAAV